MKGKKSILEKFGFVEKVLVESEGENELQKEVEADLEPEKVYHEEMKKVGEKREEREIVREESLLEAMKNKKLSTVEEIYSNYKIDSEGINSLFIIESFVKALPEFLPVDVKRKSTLNIVASSGVMLENLLRDGEARLRCLKDFSQGFLNDTREKIKGCEDEIRKLNAIIDNYKRAIDDMKRLEEEQSTLVMYEVQRVNSILEFIDPEK